MGMPLAGATWQPRTALLLCLYAWRVAKRCGTTHDDGNRRRATQEYSRRRAVPNLHSSDATHITAANDSGDVGSGSRDFLQQELEYIMMQFNNQQPGSGKKLWSTEELARFLALRPQSIRKRYSQTGSYFGIVPIKLLNNRLAWPLESIDQLKKNGQGE